MPFIVSARKVAVGSSLAAVSQAGAGCSTITPTGAQIPSHSLLQHTKKVEGEGKAGGENVSLKNPGRTLSSGLSGHKSIYFGASVECKSWTCHCLAVLNSIHGFSLGLPQTKTTCRYF